MTDDTKDVDAIEKDIAQERDALARAIDELTTHFSPERIVGEVKDHLKANGGDLAAELGATVKANPVAAVMVGVGAAWLLAGRASTIEPQPAYKTDTDVPLRSAALPTPTPISRGHVAQYGSEGRPPSPGFDTRMAALAETEQPSWWQRVSDSDTVEAVRTRLSEGLDDLSPEAKARITSLRERAVQTQSVIEDRLHATTTAVRDKTEDNPLGAALLAAAAGALVGAALPNSRREDEVLHAHRDRLVSEAEALYHSEKSKLLSASRAALNEASTMAKEAGEQLSLKDSAARVAHAARNGMDASAS
ncbi:MAG: DUF3618 domain-containing protein [Pseudomonadota bacterium]